MLAYIFALTVPLLPLFARKLYRKSEKLSTRETVFRCVVYIFVTNAITTAVMAVLCEEGTSLLEKVDKSPLFALKFMALLILSAVITAAAEWQYETGRMEISVDTDGFQRHIAVRLLRGAASVGLYLLAAFTAILNVTLIFDNVLWGDEAYSANLVRRNISDMLQIISLEESHPPLYYLWLKMWVELLGRSGIVFHLASLFLFLIGLVLAVTLVRKRYGMIPTAFFVVFTGMSETCLTYNVEIRMYAMAFLAVAFCFYSAGQILNENKPVSWIGMIFWGLAAAYSHYLALLTVTILMTVTCLLAIWRFGAKTWIRAITGGLAFIAGYLPWLYFMIRAVNRVKSDWWLEKSDSLERTVSMIFGGSNMTKILLPLLIVMLVLLFVIESSAVKGKRTETKLSVRICAPRARTLSAGYLFMLTGLTTIVLTLASAYFADIVYRPILSRRYVYPLGGVAAMMAVAGASRLLRHLGDWQKGWKLSWPEALGKGVLLLILAILMLTGIRDYRQVYGEMKSQSVKTEAALAQIGEPVENMVLVSNGVKHIGWTVLAYYYPDAEVCNDNYSSIDADDFWYFTPEFLTEQDISAMIRKGYLIGGYGECQISTYKFVLYHFFK